MRHKMTWVVACALAGGLIAAGCGGSDDNNDSTGATTAAEALSKTAFIQQADQICKQSNRTINQAGNALGDSATKAQVESFVTDTVVPGIQEQIDGIKALGAPAGDEAQVTAIVDAAQADLDKVKSDPSQLEGNNDLFADANKLAQEYGLQVCGQ